jgi:hypothetical protein
MKIEILKRGQTVNQAEIVNVENLDALITWCQNFGSFGLGESVQEIRITFKESPFVAWIQLYLDSEHLWKGTLITNDYPIGKLNSLTDVILFIKCFMKENC